MEKRSAPKCKDSWDEMLSAIIVAAGSSQRMGFDKLLALLGDRPVLAHAIDAFDGRRRLSKLSWWRPTNEWRNSKNSLGNIFLRKSGALFRAENNDTIPFAPD